MSVMLQNSRNMELPENQNTVSSSVNNETVPQKGSTMVEDKEKPPHNDRTFTKREQEKAKEVHPAKEDLELAKREGFVCVKSNLETEEDEHSKPKKCIGENNTGDTSQSPEGSTPRAPSPEHPQHKGESWNLLARVYLEYT
ncbi:hypothetical protein CRENBAI_022716 [Crenichthys baileyi]|uniref:Uncharacterized protein n=1 Tax=Crenichthys baileyi TaxID=28760 RepID=A0AAV9SGZ3_9TELE